MGPFTSRFAEVGGVTLKVVPIRDIADFAGFVVRQVQRRTRPRVFQQLLGKPVSEPPSSV
jgi:hypothetical protein